jgi:drug/metabolite transporter (DMT)-like permease
MNWISLSITALLLLSTMSILITTLTRKGYPVSFVLLGVGIIFTIFYFLQTFVLSHPAFPINPSVILMLLLIGILSALGNLALFQAANNAPNAGLAITIGAGLQAALVSILAFIFLKDKLTALQIIGIILAVFAITLINVGGASTKPNQTVITKIK